MVAHPVAGPLDKHFDYFVKEGNLASNLRQLRLHLRREHGLLYDAYPEGTRGATGELDVDAALPLLDKFHREQHGTSRPGGLIADATEITVDDPPDDWFEAEGYESTDAETTDTAAVWPVALKVSLPDITSWEGSTIKVKEEPATAVRRTGSFTETLIYETKPTLADVQRDVQGALDEFFEGRSCSDVHVHVSWDTDDDAWHVVLSASMKW